MRQETGRGLLQPALHLLREAWGALSPHAGTSGTPLMTQDEGDSCRHPLEARVFSHGRALRNHLTRFLLLVMTEGSLWRGGAGFGSRFWRCRVEGLHLVGSRGGTRFCPSPYKATRSQPWEPRPKDRIQSSHAPEAHLGALIGSPLLVLCPAKVRLAPNSWAQGKVSRHGRAPHHPFPTQPLWEGL